MLSARHRRTLEYREIIEAAKKQQKLAAVLRRLCLKDLWFLLTRLLNQKHMMQGPEYKQDWLFERCMEVQRAPDGYLDVWAREHYKDLAVDTPVLTANRGWIKHGNVIPHDLLFGSTGTPVRVVAVTDHFKDSECWCITFEHNVSIIAGGGHEWSIEVKSRERVSGTNKRIGRKNALLCTAELARLDLSPDKRPAIKIAPAIILPEVQLPIHPYILGVWLGDGHSADGRVTKPEEDLWRNILAEGYKVSDHSKRGTGTIYGIRPILRKLGLLWNKHIPTLYLFSSVAQRRALLQGLMDTDGHCNTRGTAYLNLTVESLANDALDLCRSLGLKPGFSEYAGTHGPVYQVRFQAHREDHPFRLRRKLDRCGLGVAQHRWFIRSVERVPTVVTNCVQVDSPDGIYLSGRDFIPTHNSTIISFGKTIQDNLTDPELTFLFLSYNRPSAKKFLTVIKREYEINKLLKQIFSDVLWKEPKKEAPRWSENDGIILKRRGNPKEATIEAYGLTDGMPTGGHWDIVVYEDIITKDTVRTPGMMQKVDEAYDLSLPLGKEGGRKRIVGTYYHFADKYVKLAKAAPATVRKYSATEDDTIQGRPVLFTQDRLDELREAMASYLFACQYLLNPKAEGFTGFSDDWIRHYERIPRVLNIYILDDPSSGRNKQKAKNDFTNIDVIGLGVDECYYWLDSIRDKLGLNERAHAVLDLYRKWKTRNDAQVNWTLKKIGYEEYGMQADIEHLKYVQEHEGYHLPTNLIKPLGGPISKADRIEWLVPIFEHGRFLMPKKILRRNFQGVMENVVEQFIEKEFRLWPFPEHDDGLDCKSRIKDPALHVEFPQDVPAGVLHGMKTDRERNEWDPLRD